MNTNSPLAATVTVGLPTGLDPNKVRARKGAFIAAGTEPLIAEQLAISAEQSQVARDEHIRLSLVVQNVPVTVPVAVVTTTGTLNRSETLHTMTVAALTELAGTQSVDLGGATKKADIIAALIAAEEAQQ